MSGRDCRATSSRRSSRRAGNASRRGDSGSITIWVVACGALLIAIGVISSVRSLAVLARHRAESAADLAALAAAAMIGVDPDAGCLAAQRVAAANRATVRSCVLTLDPSGRSGAVRVRVNLQVDLPVVGWRIVTASARAGRLAVPP